MSNSILIINILPYYLVNTSKRLQTVTLITQMETTIWSMLINSEKSI